MAKDKKFYSYIEGILSIICNIFIFVIKYWIGSITGSIAFTADAWHSLSDSISSIIVVIGTKISTKPADKEHPFGHGRSEHIASLIIGVFLAIVSYSFIVEAYKRLLVKEFTSYGPMAIIVLITSIIIKELLAQYAFWAAKKTKSPMLKADGWHHRSDALSSIILLIGIFLESYFWWIDAALSLIIALMIAHAAYKVFKETISTLLGESPSAEIKEAITEICNTTVGIDVKPHHIQLHTYGDHQELTLHIKLPDETPLVDAHKIATKIETRLKSDLDMLTTIHMEPINP